MLKDTILKRIQYNPLMQYIVTCSIEEDETETEDVTEIANFITNDNKVIVGSSNKVFVANVV